MALPQQTVTVLQRTALFDVVAGVAIAAYGASSSSSSLTILGVALAVVGAAMFLWARSQRPQPQGPLSDG
ncbi:hypothetical protein KSP35_17605 [Aquihabitans sp. G128]|uniref:hypothetical protein n=1 Tax=Aquihabitans sp. G128 TaxID=2849779 RepID=UPI001C23D287|nr:hypothetical protein [Aquihabitans sp. G128]QXC60154.1 hypothetical protein KSP35_17605 [Aquihabitans sp. G128]